jgi:hypothetical protein
MRHWAQALEGALLAVGVVCTTIGVVKLVVYITDHLQVCLK